MEHCIDIIWLLRPKNNTPLNNIVHQMEAKKWNIYLTVKVKFSTQITLIPGGNIINFRHHGT